jgi:hypothetical protein
LIRGARGSDTPSTWIRDERKPRHEQRVALQVGMAGRRARIPAEVVKLVADVRHLGPVHDLAVTARARVDVDDRDEVRPIDAGSLVQRRIVVNAHQGS